MVSRAFGHHELTCAMDLLPKLDAIIEKHSWVNQSGLVSQVFRTLLKVLRELGPDKGFELLVVVTVYAVPELRHPVMQVVNRIQVHVFLVPSEQSLPLAHVHIWCINSGYFLVPESLTIAICNPIRFT